MEEVFLPKISPLKRWFFTKYTRYLLAKRFNKVLVKNSYIPKKGVTSIFYGNHCYWWDALIPLALNDVFFNQDLRAIMERKQTEEWPFFLQIGAIPIEFGSLKDGKTLIKQCFKILSAKNNSLWIYPEGKFHSIKNSPGSFQPLIGSLAKSYPEVDVVCVSQYISFQESDKPSLFIDIEKVAFDKDLPRNDLLTLLHKINSNKLSQLIDGKADRASFSNLY